MNKIITAETVEAQYKIEVVFGSERSTKSTPYAILIWKVYESLDEAQQVQRSGTESLMALCPNCPNGIVARPEPTFEDPDPQEGFCDTCKTPFKTKDLVDFKMYKSGMTDLAKKLVIFFSGLKGNCDIYLKFHRTDIRYDPKERDPKKLEMSRRDRHPAIYLMRRIMEDTNNGASLEGRFKAFVTA